MNTRGNAFAEMPVLTDVLAASGYQGGQSLRGTGIVACQHLLETTGSLIECIFQQGVDPDNVFVLGKVYSTNDGVVDRLAKLGCHVTPGSKAGTPGEHGAAIAKDATEQWAAALRSLRSKGIRKIVVIDDGGTVHLTMPPKVREQFSVAGVEQTTFGMARNLRIGLSGIPVVNVASSAAKRHFETPLISKAVVDRVHNIIGPGLPPVCGVIGLGKIGLSVHESLVRKGIEVYGFDQNPQRLMRIAKEFRCSCAADVVQKSQVIFGCVGEDVLAMDDLRAAKGVKRTLVSCSSGDIEFRSVLLGIKRWKPVGEEHCPTIESWDEDRQGQISVLRSGYPVNFDNSAESVPSRDIQLTRSLLLAGVLQASRILDQNKTAFGSIMLDPRIQQIAVQSWIRHTGRAAEQTHDLQWYINESQGSQL